MLTMRTPRLSLGDLNDFQFSDTLTILKQSGLVDLVETLPEGERYTYVFDGNSQALDHIMVSRLSGTRRARCPSTTWCT